MEVGFPIFDMCAQHGLLGRIGLAFVSISGMALGAPAYFSAVQQYEVNTDRSVSFVFHTTAEPRASDCLCGIYIVFRVDMLLLGV